MYTVFALTLSGLLIGCRLGYYSDKKIGAAFGGFLGLVLGVLFGYLVALGIGRIVLTVESEYGPFTLVSMKTSQSVSGTFVLGSGSINNSWEYRFLIRNKDGSLVPYSIPADYRVKLIEDKSLKDEGYWTNIHLDPDPQSLLLPWALFDSKAFKTISNVIRVPAGSIVQKISID